MINFKILTNYAGLCNLPLACENQTFNGVSFAAAMQSTRFRMDETGVVVKSEANLTWGGNEQFIFDNPFLVMIQKKGADLPFLALWVANRELLVTLAGERDGEPPSSSW